MHIPTELQRGRSQGAGGAGMVLVGLGSLTIGILKLGLLATVVAASLTIVVGFGGLRLWLALSRDRRRRSAADDCRLTASATFGRDTGVLTITSDAVRWASAGTETAYVEEEIKSAEIRPLPLVGAAELRLLTASGSDVLFTVTAPARMVQRALSDE